MEGEGGRWIQARSSVQVCRRSSSIVQSTYRARNQTNDNPPFGRSDPTVLPRVF